MLMASSQDSLNAILASLAYGVLFFETVRQNRKNRPLVLGVCTVVMFAGCIGAGSLREQRRLQMVIWIATISLGVVILFLVSWDTVRWVLRENSARNQRADENPSSQAHSK